MSGYQGRPGPNVSQLLNELNSNNYDADFLNDESFPDDLNMFINTEFTNYDMPSLPSSTYTGGESIDAFETSSVDLQNSQTQPVYSTYNVPIQPAPPANGFSLDPNFTSPSSPTTLSQAAQSRRKVEPIQTQNLTAEEKAKLAAEEDKRRRNTAASARFRIKKKQREQTLERTVKEVSEKNTQLEAKVQQLETENQWLKDLITEKNGQQTREEIAAAYQKFRRESEEREQRETMEGR